MIRPQLQSVANLDFWLLGSAASLLIIGFVMITSASIDVAHSINNNPFYYSIRHGVFIIMGIAAAAIVFHIPTHLWQKHGWLALSLALFSLALVLVPGIGKTVNGSTRWISMGGFNIQPSELAKLLLIAYLSGYLVRRRDEVAKSWWGFLKPMIVLSTSAFLLLMEPDFGATVVLGCAFLGMIFLSGAKLGQFIVFIVGCIGSVVMLVMSQPYRLNRLTGYINPWEDPYGAGYQLTQSLIAFGRGEWLGVGLGNSIQKQFYLPEAHTDFVFAILAEEFGLIGTILTVVLFSVLVTRALMIGYRAEKSNKLYSAFFAYGIGILLGVQALINMGVNMGLLPTKGLTLPLVSYGGSSLIISCVAVGILSRIHCEQFQSVVPTKEVEEQDQSSGRLRVAH